MMKSEGSWPVESCACFGVDWIATLMESRQDGNLILASRHGWAFRQSHWANSETSRTRVFCRYNRSAGEKVGDECRDPSHPDAFGHHDQFQERHDRVPGESDSWRSQPDP